MGIHLATALSLEVGVPFVVVRKRKYGLPGELAVHQTTGYSKGELYINFWNNKLYTKDEANNLIIELCKKYNLELPSNEEEWDETFEDEGMYDNQRFNDIENHIEIENKVLENLNLLKIAKCYCESNFDKSDEIFWL